MCQDRAMARGVSDKTNEVPSLPQRLAELQIEATVVTADALGRAE